MIFDAAGPNSGDTLDSTQFEEGMRSMEARLLAVSGDFDRDEEEWAAREDRGAALFQFLGARMDGWRLRYWPILAPVGLSGGQTAVRRPVGYPSGMRDWTRGRHWDRRHRYGEA
jgi:hypothetical protein